MQRDHQHRAVLIGRSLYGYDNISEHGLHAIAERRRHIGDTPVFALKAIGYGIRIRRTQQVGPIGVLQTGADASVLFQPFSLSDKCFDLRLPKLEALLNGLAVHIDKDHVFLSRLILIFPKATQINGGKGAYACLRRFRDLIPLLYLKPLKATLDGDLNLIGKTALCTLSRFGRILVLAFAPVVRCIVLDLLDLLEYFPFRCCKTTRRSTEKEHRR